MLRTSWPVAALALYRLCKQQSPTFAAFVLLSGTPAFSDIINVTVSEGAMGSGSLTVICPPFSPPSCSSLSAPPISFSEVNASLGTFTASGSTSLQNPFNGSFDTVTLQAQQIVAATTDSLSIDLIEGASSSATFEFSADPLGFWNVSSIENDVTLSFSLMTPSIMQLTTGGAGFNSAFGQLRDSDGNVILTLPTGGTTDVLLPDGKYSLFETSGFGGTGELAGVSLGTFDYSVKAEVTPVPEPSNTAFLPLLMLLFVFTRRFYRWKFGNVRMRTSSGSA